MKKSLLIVGVLCLVMSASSAQAAKKKSSSKPFSGQGYGIAGCGLGSMAFGNDNGMIQILAATTNGTFGTQTFGISSGTSNCSPEYANTSANLNVYIEANRLALANDVSRGSGETVEGLSQVLGCKNPQALGGKLKKDYGRIFPSQDVGAEQVSASIMQSVAEDKDLSSTCHG